MRKRIITATLFALSIALASCGGGGGGGGGTGGEGDGSGDAGTTTKGLTVTSAAKKGTVSPSYLFSSGLKPYLVCADGVVEADSVSPEKIHFPGENFKSCLLTFTAPDTGSIVYTALDEITAGSGSELALGTNMHLLPVKGEVSLSPKPDADGDLIADDCEGKAVSHGGMGEAPTFSKTVIVVLEGDDMGEDSTLTPYLQENYNELVEGIQNVQPENVRFVVIWDGNQKNGLDGQSDVFILDPQSGEDFTTLTDDIGKVLSGVPISHFGSDGLLYWYAPSDNLSNHLKELIEIAIRIAPAESYDLIISDHGDGWVSLPTPTTRTVLFESFSDGNQTGTTWLGTKQFVDSVLAPLAKEGIRFNLLGFDECLMGELATLSLLKGYADVIVASPEFEPGTGWGTVWKNLPSWYEAGDDAWTIGKKIVDGYVKYYKENPPDNPLGSPMTIGLTAVKSDALEQLVNAFEDFAGDLYQTAQNEVGNGQMHQYFYSRFSNNDVQTYQGVFWWLNTADYTGDDPTAQEFDNTTRRYTQYYGGTQGYDTLGFDLVQTVSAIGYTARLVDLGYTNFYAMHGLAYTPYNSSNAYTPSFSSTTVQDALNFLSTYNSTVENDQLYTDYLYLDMQGGYNDNVTGSGLSLIYPYTSPDYAQTPRMEICNYQNFVESYNETLPNYTAFVNTVFDVMWQAIRDSGLDQKFSCDADTGNVVWQE